MSYPLNDTPMSDELFPVGQVIAFDGFVYTISSAPIREGELLITMQQLEYDEEPVPIIAICQEVGITMLSVNSAGTIFDTPKSACRRLTFTIPIDSTHFINN